MVDRLKNDAGYSLIEVVVAIMLLGLAILPMIGMFDAGLRAAVVGSNYEGARALANEKLEEIRSLPYNNPGAPNDSVVEIYPPGTTPDQTQGNYTYTVTTQYLQEQEDGSVAAPPSGVAGTMMRVTVTVEWETSSSYTTTEVVTR